MENTNLSVYFNYFFIFAVALGAVYFCARSARDGYWGEDSEEMKYRMLNDDDSGGEDGRK